jgi:hypothetical protein
MIRGARTQLPRSTRATPQYLRKVLQLHAGGSEGCGAARCYNYTLGEGKDVEAHGLVEDDACMARRSRMFSGRMSAWIILQSCMAHAADRSWCASFRMLLRHWPRSMSVRSRLDTESQFSRHFLRLSK